jgi:hypothetical protein
LLNFAGTAGQISTALCNDAFRLNPVFRTNCGCPALPPAPTAAPTRSAPPSDAPSISVRPTISARPTYTITPSINDTLSPYEILFGFLFVIGLACFTLFFICLCPLLCQRKAVVPNGASTTVRDGDIHNHAAAAAAETPNNHNNTVEVPSIYWQEGTANNEHFDYKTSQQYHLQQAQANRWCPTKNEPPRTSTETTA